MNLPDLDHVLHVLGAPAGSLASVLWLKETLWQRRFLLFLGGWLFSVGSEAQVARWTHLETGFLLGFMLGVGSMAFFAKVLETWQSFNAGSLLRDVLRKWLGLAAVATRPGQLPKE